MNSSEINQLVAAFSAALKTTLLPELRRVSDAALRSERGAAARGHEPAARRSTRAAVGGETLGEASNEVAQFDKNIAKTIKELNDRVNAIMTKLGDSAGKSFSQVEADLTELASAQRELFKNIESASVLSVGRLRSSIIKDVEKVVKANSALFGETANKLRKAKKLTSDDVSEMLSEINERQRLLSGAKKANAERMKSVMLQLKQTSADVFGTLPGTATAQVSAGTTIDRILVKSIIASSIIVAKGNEESRLIRKALAPQPLLGEDFKQGLDSQFKLLLSLSKGDAAKTKELTELFGKIKVARDKTEGLRVAGDFKGAKRAGKELQALIEQLNAHLGAASAAELNKARALGTAFTATSAFGKILTSTTSFLTASAPKLNQAFSYLGKKIEQELNLNAVLPSTLSYGAALALVTDGLFDMWREFRNIATLGLGGAFLDVSLGAVNLGMRLEDFAEMMTENRNVLVGFGGNVGALTAMMRESTKTLTGYGLAGKDAAEATMSMIQAAKSFGVSIVDNQDGLSGSIARQTKLFTRMSAVTGLSIKTLAQQAKALAESSTMQETLARLTLDERQARMMDLMQQKEILIRQGLSAEKADRILEAQEKVLKASVKERYESAARILQLSGVVGLGAEGAELARILMKGQRASPEDRRRQQELSRTLAQAVDQTISAGGLGQENLLNELMSSLGPLGGDIIESGREQALAIQNAISAEREQEMVDNLSKINGAAAAAIDIQSRIEAAISTGFTKVLVGLGAITALLMKDTVSKALKALLPRMSKLGEMFSGGTLSKLGAFSKVLGAAGAVISGGLGAFNADKILGKENLAVTDYISSAIGGIVEGFTFSLIDSETIAKPLAAGFDYMKSALTDMFELAFSTIFSGGWWSDLWSAGIEKAKVVFANVQDWVGKSLDSTFTSVFDGIKNSLSAVLSITNLDKIASAVNDQFDMILSMFKTIADNARLFWDKITSFFSVDSALGKISSAVSAFFGGSTTGSSPVVPSNAVTAIQTPTAMTTPRAINAAGVAAPPTPATAAVKVSQPAGTAAVPGAIQSTINSEVNSAGVIAKLEELILLTKQELELARAYYQGQRVGGAPSVNAARTLQRGVFA